MPVLHITKSIRAANAAFTGTHHMYGTTYIVALSSHITAMSISHFTTTTDLPGGKAHRGRRAERGRLGCTGRQRLED